MIRKYTFLVIALSSFVMAGKDCPLSIESLKQSGEVYTIVLRHSQKCNIVMEHNRSHISLLSKPISGTTAVVDSNGSTAISKTEKIIALAKSKLGDAYEPAKAGPDHFDCSGFVYYVFTQNGIKIPRTSLAQSQSGKKIKREDLKRGDILFFDTHARKHVNHSGIYLGGGKFIHASSGKAYSVTISDLDSGFYQDKFRWGVRK